MSQLPAMLSPLSQRQGNIGEPGRLLVPTPGLAEKTRILVENVGFDSAQPTNQPGL